MRICLASLHFFLTFAPEITKISTKMDDYPADNYDL